MIFFVLIFVLFLFPAPILVNEWFVVTVCLNNEEDVAVHDVVVSASLVKHFTTI
jgi:hypothetical protein